MSCDHRFLLKVVSFKSRMWLFACKLDE